MPLTRAPALPISLQIGQWLASSMSVPSAETRTSVLGRARARVRGVHSRWYPAWIECENDPVGVFAMRLGDKEVQRSLSLVRHGFSNRLSRFQVVRDSVDSPSTDRSFHCLCLGILAQSFQLQKK